MSEIPKDRYDEVYSANHLAGTLSFCVICTCSLIFIADDTE